jgi:hypothetical protein
MTERERDESEPEADPANPEVGRPSSGLPTERTDAGMVTDQAIINQEPARESGEKNVV